MTNESEAGADAGIVERITASFARQGMMIHLGARLGRIDRGRVHIHLPIGPAVTQQLGYFHGGATGAIADSAGGYAALSVMQEGFEVLSVEYKLNLLAPAVGEELEAIGTVIRPGRTLTICRIDVYAHSGEQRKLVAAAQQTLIGVPTE